MRVVEVFATDLFKTYYAQRNRGEKSDWSIMYYTILSEINKSNL